MLKKMTFQGLLMATLIAGLSGGYALLRAPTLSAGVTEMASLASFGEGDD